MPPIFNKQKKAAPKPETSLCPGELQREWSLSSKIRLNNSTLPQFRCLLTSEMMFLLIFQVGQSCAPALYIAWEQRTKHNHTISNSAAFQCRVPYLYCFFTWSNSTLISHTFFNHIAFFCQHPTSTPCTTLSGSGSSGLHNIHCSR